MFYIYTIVNQGRLGLDNMELSRVNKNISLFVNSRPSIDLFDEI